MDSLAAIVNQCRKDSIDWFGDETANNLSIYSLGLAGEAGEFCDELKKVMRGSQSLTDALPKLSEELADLFIYVCNVAALLHVDLGREYDDKRERNVHRFSNAGTGNDLPNPNGEGSGVRTGG